MHLLVPMDLDKTSKSALKEAILLTEKFKETGKITILHVVNSELSAPVVDSAEDLETKLLAEARDYLAKIKAIVEKKNILVEVVILEGFVATKILDYEKEHAVDLIVIGHHNRMGFDRLVVGSVSKKVIHDAICPVVVVK